MEELIQQLKVVQATAFSLYLKAHNFHWNITGPDFAQYHLFLETVYNQIFESVDGYAEKIRALDSFAPGSLIRFTQLTKIQDEVNIPTGLAMFAKLAIDNDTLIAELYATDALCDQLNQRGIQNFIQGQIDDHEKLRWMLKSFGK
jgi:starvation-inducible DNA-binding protein